MIDVFRDCQCLLRLGTFCSHNKMKCEPIFLSCSGYKSLETAAAAFTLKWQVLPLTDHNLINGDDGVKPNEA